MTTRRRFEVHDVNGVDPSREDEGALRPLLAEYGVLCLRIGRKLTEPEVETVARRFGPIKDPVGRTKDGGTFRYSEAQQHIDTGFVVTEELRQQLGPLEFGGLDDERPGLFETYHCDDTFVREPALASVLHARALPPSGGGPTCFIDMRAAYDGLDESTKRDLEGLRVVYVYNNEGAFPPRRPAKGEAEVLAGTTHPLVRTHPVAGTRSLFIDLDRATHIEGMPVDEGRALLRELQDHAERSAPSCEHHWTGYDVLVWDNASVQHKAQGNFVVGEPRRFWRYLIEGDRPA